VDLDRLLTHLRIGRLERLGFENDGRSVDDFLKGAGAVEMSLGVDDALGALSLADADGFEFRHVETAEAEVMSQFLGLEEDGLSGQSVSGAGRYWICCDSGM
jgi:hypothetical protein